MGLKRYGTDEFIRRSNEMHDEKYDYSRVEYVSAKKKVVIICPQHGLFEQEPQHHIKGVGCPGCKAYKQGLAKLLTQEEFLERAQAVHGGRYDYSQTAYELGKNRITVVCSEHGPFEEEARVHIHQGTGCPECTEWGV